MKHIISLIILVLLLSTCSEGKQQSFEELIASDNLEQIRAKKSELDAEQQQIATQLRQLEEKIKTLDPQEKIPLITTFQVEEQVFNHYLELQGSVDTKQNIVVFPEFTGIMTNVYVKKGQNVSRGQALAKIDDGGLSQQVAQLEIQADLAKTTFERQKRLWEQKIGSEIQYLQSKSNYEAQVQAVNQLKQQVGKTIVRAPFSGTIDDVISEQGTVVNAGQSQLFRIVNLNDMYIETDVPERYVTNVKKGKDVVVEFPILGTTMDAKIREAGNFINPANRTFKVEIAVPNKDKTIKPNLTAKLKINDYTNDKAILIPQSIISENAEGKQYVYTVTDKNDSLAKAKKVFVKTGKTQGDLIEVLEGINNGDEIIKEGARSVQDDQQVKVLSAQA